MPPFARREQSLTDGCRSDKLEQVLQAAIMVPRTSGVSHHILKTVWFLVGNGGMDYEDYYWGLYGDYYRDPFPQSLLSTRQKRSHRANFHQAVNQCSGFSALAKERPALNPKTPNLNSKPSTLNPEPKP